MLQKIKTFYKKETILLIASFLAIASCFAVPPDISYKDYIDTRTVLLLFCLMAVMIGLQEIGLFRFVGSQLLKKVKTEKGLLSTLIFLCFFSSMFVTNDVALLTFVPFSILVLRMANQEQLLCSTIILQTIGANLGSMLTPVGNPQNLYLYTQYQIPTNIFFAIMLPYTLVAGLLLYFSVAMLCRKKRCLSPIVVQESPPNKQELGYYLFLFIVCLFAVARIFSVALVFVVILFSILYKNKTILKKVDYSLLLTFIAFFLFIGNMGRLPEFHTFISDRILGNEKIVAVFASQIISNVPAALLLSGFTNAWKGLLLGTNLGGLGTLIASMASLISYKKIALHYPTQRLRYLLSFTLWNLIFLAILLGISMLFP